MSKYIKYKVGDRVRIVENSTKAARHDWSIGQIGVIVGAGSGSGEGYFPFLIRCDNGKSIRAKDFELKIATFKGLCQDILNET